MVASYSLVSRFADQPLLSATRRPNATGEAEKGRTFFSGCTCGVGSESSNVREPYAARSAEDEHHADPRGADGCPGDPVPAHAASAGDELPDRARLAAHPYRLDDDLRAWRRRRPRGLRVG